MNRFHFSLILVVVVLLLLPQAGCESEPVELSPAINKDSEGLSAYKGYSAVKLAITPLTEIIETGSGREIIAYVNMLDRFDCSVKGPGVFRFELYEYVPRSVEPKGKRLVIWQDIDLSDADDNNGYWLDFMRVYKFQLDIEPQLNGGCVLQTTCICPNGKRLLAEAILGNTK